MFKFTNNQKTQKLVQGFLLAVTLAAVPINAAMSIDPSREWLLKVETEELKRQFNYKDSQLNPHAKVVVNYARADRRDKLFPYTMYWYKRGKPIGLERPGKFGLTKGDVVSIEVEHKDRRGGEEEYKAAANMILRLSLDAYHNHNPVLTIKLPADSFDQITTEMELLNCVEKEAEGDGSVRSKMSFNVISKPEGHAKTLHFM